MNGCLIVSTYPPRKCGIATFSKDLRDNLVKYTPRVLVAAINDPDNSYMYPAEVVVQLSQERKAAYQACARWVNQNPDIDIVIIQHEYGIFGGQDGDHILNLAKKLTKPYLIVVHTVLPQPSASQKHILTQLTGNAAGIICMTERASGLLETVYNAAPGKTHVIPHGVPAFTPKDRDTLKNKYGLQGRRIITTFGLIGPGKGLELGIKALASVVEDHPDVLYIIAGLTHPSLLRSEGERYRDSIIEMVQKLNLEDHVLFVNRYLDDEELGDYLYMTDIYLSPYPNLDQAVSGTLSFAVGCGRAIVATPYEHAREILAERRGLVAQAPTPEALAQPLAVVLKNPGIQEELEFRAAKLGETLTWSSVAELYHDIAGEVVKLDKAHDYGKARNRIQL